MDNTNLFILDNLNTIDTVIGNGLNTLTKCVEFAPVDEEGLLNQAILITDCLYLKD